MVRSQFDDPPPPRQYYQRREESYRSRNQPEAEGRNSYYNLPSSSTQYQQQVTNPSYSQYMNYDQQIPSFPYQQYQPFGMGNPIGSIVGLRVIQLDSGLGYIPVEPHINYLINQQFGRGPIQANTPFHGPSVGNFPSSQTITASSTPASIPPADPGPHRSQQRTQSQDPPKRQQKEIEDNWFKPTPQPKSGVRRSAQWKNDEDYDPWGRGGAGAPMRDSLGRIVADRGKLRAAFRNRAGSLANLSISDTPQTLTRQTIDQPLSSQELHKLDLIKQIEENKRRREIERQQELDFERKEMRKLEEYNLKIRREEEEERKREKDRAAAMERRAAVIAAEQDARARQIRRRLSPPAENVEPRGRRGSGPTHRASPLADDEELPPKLEWWERKANYDDPRKSAVIPTMRNGQATRPASRNGRHAYSPAESVRQHQSRGQSRDQPRSENTATRGVSSRPRRASIPAHNQRPPNPDDERPIRPSGTNPPLDDSMPG
ncbi:unnamed protein product, partial [Mesorhabditis belari]|uniref:Uncharacterized protein n=1 Tax=Mesorhabditis belari TaxID=2138241 RepID=A0AAF3FN11_9BILA